MGKKGPKGDIGVKGAKGDPAVECDCLKNTEIANWMDNLKVSAGKVADLRREAILPDERKTETLHMEVVSRGANDGWHANIFVNGVEKRGPTYYRGYNFVVIDPLTKAISTKAFDTYAHHDLVDKMNDYIDGIPIGSIVTVAVKDAVQKFNISNSPEKRRGLDSLGAGGPGCPYGIFRDSWALLTLKVPSLDEIPDWFRCQHTPRYEGIANVTANINTSEIVSKYDLHFMKQNAVKKDLTALEDRLKLLEDKTNEIMQVLK